MGESVRFEVMAPGTADLHDLFQLRLRCLNDGASMRSGELAGDRDSSTRHVLAWSGPDLVGAGTLVLDPAPFSPRALWRLRALAVAPEFRCQGVGGQLITLRLALCTGSPAWANVRTGVSEALHLSLGGVRVGDPYLSADSWSPGQMVRILHHPSHCL